MIIQLEIDDELLNALKVIKKGMQKASRLRRVPFSISNW